MMASHKSKQYWLVALKVLLLVLALGYMLLKIKEERTTTLEHFKASFQIDTLPYWLWFVGLATLNWLLEIYKWNVSVSTWFPLTFKEAAKQTLGSLTASLITPNRIGEYGAKAMYFPPKNRKKIVFLNFVHSSSQMLVTLFFGIPALLLYVIRTGDTINLSLWRILLGTGILLLLVAVAYSYRKRPFGFKGMTLSTLWKKFRQISIKRKTGIVGLSMLRYMVFSTLFYSILRFSGTDIHPEILLITIFTMYLLVSVIPSFFVLDVVIRGGVGVWLFSFLGVPEIVVLSTVFMMWILNTVLPAILGSYFVLTFKPTPR
tara:strand:- start:46896 stop:47846 length:951 start_codon:yes stop_codon:yes gene_type:complete